MADRRGGALVLAIVLAGCGPAGTGGSRPESSPPASGGQATRSSPSVTVSAEATLPPEVSRVIEFPDAVYGIAAAGNTIWVEGNNRLYQLDGETGERLQELTGAWPTVTSDALWYIRGEQLVEAVSSSGRELAAYTPPVLGTTVRDGVLWAASEETHELTAVDLATNKTLHQMVLPAGEPKWVEWWEDAIWVVVDGANVVLRVDPSTGAVITSTPGGRRPHSVATGFGSLWVTEHGSANVRRFGPDGSLQATIPGPGINVAITAVDDAIWAAGREGIIEIDPATNELGREIRLGSGDWYALTHAASSLWLTSADAGSVLQIALDQR